MSTHIKVPTLPESVTDATVVAWHKQPGDAVVRDENLVDLETDKVVLEVPAPDDGVLSSIVKDAGSVVVAGDVLATLQKNGAKSTAVPKTATSKVEPKVNSQASTKVATSEDLSPAVRRLVQEHNLDATQIKGTGKDGRVTKSDVDGFIRQRPTDHAVEHPSSTAVTAPHGERLEKRVPMSRLRARVAERLVQIQQDAAILTTFNEVNLQAVIELRNRYKVPFEKKHGIKLGFMSFFVKAAVDALKRFPSVNASIDGNDIVYHGFYDIGVAVSTERGLVVPILRNADQMSLSDIEHAIAEYASKAREGQLTIEEMSGGTFTISNGGIFGSLLSTPILNPPQSAILGMHKIEQRPVVEDGQIVARPMMYLALSYDHRIVDGKESVSFLAAIKEYLEFPAKTLLEI